MDAPVSPLHGWSSAIPRKLLSLPYRFPPLTPFPGFSNFFPYLSQLPVSFRQDSGSFRANNSLNLGQIFEIRPQNLDGECLHPDLPFFHTSRYSYAFPKRIPGFQLIFSSFQTRSGHDPRSFRASNSLDPGQIFDFRPSKSRGSLAPSKSIISTSLSPLLPFSQTSSGLPACFFHRFSTKIVHHSRLISP